MSRSFRVALQFLTVLPVRVEPEPDERDLGRSARWFAMVGTLIGTVLVLGCALLTRWFPPAVAATLGVMLWASLTGGLHLDGLADCCDALPGARSAARRLEIMRDPRLGSFGTVGLVLFLVAKVATLATLLGSGRAWGALLLAPTLGRGAMVVQAWSFPLARPDGLAARLRAGMGIDAVAAATAFCVMMATRFGASGLMGLVAAGLMLTAIGELARRRLGGVTGDVYGATCEVVELGVLLVASIHI